MPAGASAAGAYNDFDCKPSRSKPAPVVLVHGTFTTGRVSWAVMGPELARYVARVRRATGARRVKLVGHSQGGMMPRFYLRYLGGRRYADELIALSPSNHGTLLGVGTDPDVCPACAQQGAGSAFLRKLNRGREVERGVDYTVLQTRHDDGRPVPLGVPARAAQAADQRAPSAALSGERREPRDRPVRAARPAVGRARPASRRARESAVPTALLSGRLFDLS